LSIGDRNQVAQLSQRDQQTYLTDPQKLNSYSYGRDNPVTLKDSDGRQAYGINLNAGAEGGLGLFAAGIFSIGLTYVRNPDTGKASIAIPISFGTNAGFFGAYQSYPDSKTLPTILGVFGGFGPSLSYSPNAKTPQDLAGDQNSLNANIPAVSFSVQGAGTNNPTYTAGPGVKALGSMSSYPVRTWVPYSVSTQTVWSNVNMAINRVGGAFQAVVNSIQAQINSIRSQVQKLQAQSSSVNN
jgi:hypothetical protein